MSGDSHSRALSGRAVVWDIKRVEVAASPTPAAISAQPAQWLCVAANISGALPHHAVIRSIGSWEKALSHARMKAPATIVASPDSKTATARTGASTQRTPLGWGIGGAVVANLPRACRPQLEMDQEPFRSGQPSDDTRACLQAARPLERTRTWRPAFRAVRAQIQARSWSAWS